jgi:hypothetical protein
VATRELLDEKCDSFVEQLSIEINTEVLFS